MAEREVLEEFELADGRKVRVYRARVRDLVNAQRKAPAGNDQVGILLALLSEVVEIDGKRLPGPEDWMDMDLGEFFEIAGKAFPLLGISRMTLPPNVWPSPEKPA